MNIGIIGSGNMGAALGKIWAARGHNVLFSFSKEETVLTKAAQEAGHGAQTGTPAQAAQHGEVVLVAVWPAVLEAALREAGSLDGKIVLTCVSGLTPDMQGQTMGLPTDLKISMAEQIAALSPGARVVEAFNTTFAEILASPTRQFGNDRPSVFYCSDDLAAKATVAQLIEECGYEAVDAGGLHTARALETLATAWVQFAAVSKLFPNLGLKALRR